MLKLKKKKRTKIKVLSTLAILLLVLGTGVFVGISLSNKNVAKAATPVKGYAVEISDEDLGEVKEIAEIYGYKRPYSFNYKPFKDEEFAFEDSKDDNFIKSFINWTDKKLNMKSISFNAKSEIRLGYDLADLNSGDVTYKESTKTLYVKPPRLKMNILIDYSDTNDNLGLLKYLFDRFTPAEIDEFHDGARKEVENKFLQYKKQGYEQTNKAYENIILNKEYSFDVEKVVFLENDQDIEILNQELEEY